MIGALHVLCLSAFHFLLPLGIGHRAVIKYPVSNDFGADRGQVRA